MLNGCDIAQGRAAANSLITPVVRVDPVSGYDNIMMV